MGRIPCSPLPVCSVVDGVAQAPWGVGTTVGSLVSTCAGGKPPLAPDFLETSDLLSAPLRPLRSLYPSRSLPMSPSSSSATATTTMTTSDAAMTPKYMTRPDSAPTASATGISTSKRTVRVRRLRRRLSAPSAAQSAPKLCRSLSHNLEALDLSSASPTQALASLRFLVLSYLADLERRLRELGSPDYDAWKLSGESTMEDAAQWARTALDMLDNIRADVCSHLPEVPFADLSSVEAFVKSHLPDLPDVPNFTEMRSRFPDMAEMRSRFPDMPHLPDMAEMRSHLPEIPSLPDMDEVRGMMRHKLEDVRTLFKELDLQEPLGYIPTLSDHLDNLNSHLSSIDVDPDAFFLPNTGLYDYLDSLLNSDFLADILGSVDKPTEQLAEGEGMFEHAAHEVTAAVQRSLQGVKLIRYDDLPHPWRNNPFVEEGYRFIPLERWPLLVASVFKPHNELLNIHTHLIPFLLWGASLVPIIRDSSAYDAPEIAYMLLALLCLISSAIWHTMSGCADHGSMEMCARVDYVGIGWLISASVGSIAHYGFNDCHPNFARAFLALCFVTGMAGNIFSFMAWFNKHEYRYYRIAFFLSLAFAGVAPMVTMTKLHSFQEMFNHVAPVLPSLGSYIIGLVFYAAHFPERIVPAKFRRYLDKVGANSHAIWHCFIVLAVSQHRAAIGVMKVGVQTLECVAPST
ncbi:hypothetical protein D9619_001316 [Psilocybe cf. subviscida]|uniref:HlyIII-domain-containing protein n=1 Tax=Psilocybe cf. subviscida TaxID=2480587 RepID=A0A8H5BI71_9AGAR|nr:hypothetical protein D9619_001316 [Psilocybe cf. subviscida]